MATQEDSASIYQDGTVPADADLGTSSDDGVAAETDHEAQTGTEEPDADDDELIGTTAQQEPNPNALVDGNRVAVAEHME